MNHRHTVLIDNRAATADLVEIFNLRGLAPMSELLVVYKALNTTSVPLEHPAQCITKIQIVDGSTVILDLSGKQAQALSYYHYKAPTVNGLSYISGNYCWAACRIPFGRWLWDPILALDPARFGNLQVIVYTDLNGGGAGTPVAGVLEVSASLFDDKKIAAAGYLRHREHFRYSVVASGEMTVDLPVDNPLKMIMFMGDYKDTALIQQINRIKITQDNDAKVHLNNSTSDILKMLSGDIQPWTEKLRGNGTTNAVEHFITQFYEATGIMGGIMATPNYASVTQTDGGTCDIDSFALGEFDVLTHGYAPHGCVGVEFGDPWDLEDWWMPGRGSELKAKLTAGAAASANGINKVITSQLIKY